MVQTKDLETEINLLKQQLKDKDNQLQKAEAKLKQQEKLANIGMLTAEIFHDSKNLMARVRSSASVILSRLEDIEKSFDEAKYLLGNDFDKIFGEVLTDLIPKSKNSLLNIDEKILWMHKLTKKVDEHLEVKIIKNLNKENLISEKGEEQLNNLDVKTFNEDDLVITDINSIVQECLNLACEVAQKKKLEKGEEKLNLNLDINVSPTVSRVKVHQENLRRILINLIDNAFYAVYEKKQKIGESYCPTISVSTEKLEDESIAIIVEDNGEGVEIGLWEAMKPLITTKPQGEGTGLGLPIVQKLCRESKIKLNASTEPGSYTKFNLLLSQS